uniref:Uncharacterized protein n=1 Tax=Arundo donax TaxID=35708 RepID=A0A0A8Z8N1_ARUDO
MRWGNQHQGAEVIQATVLAVHSAAMHRFLNLRSQFYYYWKTTP